MGATAYPNSSHNLKHNSLPADLNDQKCRVKPLLTTTDGRGRLPTAKRPVNGPLFALLLSSESRRRNLSSAMAKAHLRTVRKVSHGKPCTAAERRNVLQGRARFIHAHHELKLSHLHPTGP